MKEKSRGITLMVLIITIMFLLILAGVTVESIIDNDEIEKAKSSENIINTKTTQTEIEVEGILSERNLLNVPSEEDTNLIPATLEENPEITFSTEYGTIDVIWLRGNSNTVTDKPNAPILAESGNNMTPVTWTYYENGYDSDNNGELDVDSAGNTIKWFEDTRAKSEWYSYTAGTGTTDNLSSHWANAKTANGAYFVWIPRYAYRITYYSDSAKTEATGYYDGYGMWRASDGKLRYELEEEIETVTYNGKKYIVHPAFTECVDMGGWDSDIEGFWTAKYEMSGTTTSLTSVPNETSLRSMSIGDQYVSARNATYGYSNCPSETINSAGTSYSHTSYMHSHMMKNSEWGAVAYLTHSQYGRNGNEIDINNSSSYITGNGGGSTSTSEASGTTNAYNTELGVKASSTGNIYGIYDLSGGAWEYIAGYDKSERNTYYLEGSDYGENLTKEVKDGSENYISTKYATAYSNGTNSETGNSIIYGSGKTGDATKEVNKGGADSSTSTSNYHNWQNVYSNFVYLDYPFFRRGGRYDNGVRAGVFSSHNLNGYKYSYYSFRTVLVL